MNRKGVFENSLWLKIFNRLPTSLWWPIARQQLGSCGFGVHLPRDGAYSLSNLYLGNDVHVGIHSYLSAENSRIFLGDKVAMGPGVMIFGGNRNMGLHGKFMFDVTDEEKLASDDKDVVLEEDVWVGGGVIITSGVHIGRGAVVGAGSIVRRSVPPYCIVAGDPAKILRMRGSIEEILAHEAKLYPEEKRLSRARLEKLLGVRTGGGPERAQAQQEIPRCASPR
jgi:acetyltransferase-like isoleucine patch superfamily enzyme